MKKRFFLLFLAFAASRLFAEFTFDLNYAVMPDNQNNKIGKIQIRNINDLRKERKDNPKLGLDFIGNLRNGFGVPFRCTSTMNIDVTFKNLIIESLKYAGFEAVEYDQSSNLPVLDIDILDCVMDGYGGFYGIGVKLKAKLFKAENNELLFDKTESMVFPSERERVSIQLYEFPLPRTPPVIFDR